MFKNRGLSLAESMVSLLIMSVVVAATIPLMTKMTQTKTGVEPHTLKCITSGDFSFYDETTGDTSMPSEGTECYYAVEGAKYGTSNTLGTIKWRLSHGTDAEKIAANKIFRAACDEGGEKACDHFIDKCRTEGSSSDPFCDEAGNDFDVTYYLQQSGGSTNKGAVYVSGKVEDLLPYMSESLVGEVENSCTAASNSIACSLYQPWIYIKGCNLGYESACTEAHDNNYNKSCSQIKDAWTNAPSDTYKLTYDGADSLNDAYCNTTSAPIAAISGCNAITDDSDNCTAASGSGDDCSDDCLIAYTNNYNRECNDILQNWIGAPYGTYNLTEDGAPPTALVQDTCEGAVPNCTDSVGSVCLDGTVYAGKVNTIEIFTTLADVSDAGITWNDGTTNYQTRYAGMDPLPNSLSDGEYNSYIINNWTDGTWSWGTIEDSPYYAAKACEDLNTASYLGYTDWYLPSREELRLLYDGQDDIGGFTSTYYWSSSECDWDEARYINFSSGTTSSCQGSSLSKKNMAWRVRCVRNNETFTPPDLADTSARVAVDCSSGSPDIGDLCTDGTVYAGSYRGYNLYIKETNEPGTYTWNNGSTNYQTRYVNFSPLPSSTNDGEYNSYIINNWVNNTYPWGIIEDGPYNAANVCQDLNDSSYLGYTDWYLPAKDELAYLYTNRAAIGGFYQGEYWSSTEAPTSPTRAAWLRSFSTGASNDYYKYSSRYVRCVRNDDSFTPPTLPTVPPTVDCHDATADDIGDRCLDGSIYAGEYGSPAYEYFVAPNDEPGGYPSAYTYFWNNGTDEWTNTGATSATDGASNYSILINSIDDGNPYYAAQACKALNDVSYLGYNDWFLPSRGELAYILMNYEDIGTFASTNYWSSSEYDSDEAYRIHSDSSVHQYYIDTSKNSAFRVRCVRKE